MATAARQLGSFPKFAHENSSRPGLASRLRDKLLGPAATEVGQSLVDSVKVWRLRRQLRLFHEVKRMLEATTNEIKPIATRLFFPVLEAASVEDDDEMQTRWCFWQLDLAPQWPFHLAPPTAQHSF